MKRRRVVLAVAITLGLMLLAWGALQLAIAHNGAAVLNAVDRIASLGSGGKLVEHAAYGANPAQRLDVYRVGSAAEKRPVMIFVYGGSWYWGNPADYAFAGRSLAERGFLTIVPGYRLYPEVRYPAMLEDTAEAIRWAHENAARLGGDPATIWLIGHSAGAYNVVQVALETRWLSAARVPPESIAGVIGLAGPYDFYPFDTDATRNSFGEARDPAATQPINHVGPDAPPMLLVHGEPDTTVKVRNSRALAAALEAQGNLVELAVYPQMDHYDPLISLARPWRDRRDVMRRIEAFIARSRLATGEKGRVSSLDIQGETR